MNEVESNSALLRYLWNSGILGYPNFFRDIIDPKTGKHMILEWSDYYMDENMMPKLKEDVYTRAKEKGVDLDYVLDFYINPGII